VPIYEYVCHACGEEHEKIQKASDRPLRKCPSCGALKLRRKVSRSAFHLKGGGWYVSDYKANGKKPAAAESSSNGEGAVGEKPGEKQKKTESKTSESKASDD